MYVRWISLVSNDYAFCPLDPFIFLCYSYHMTIAMRIWWYLLLISLVASAAMAVPRGEYLRVRGTVSPVSLQNGVEVSAQLAGLAGKTLELEGTVACTFDGKNGPGFILTLPGNQLVTVLSAQPDPMVQAGYTLQTLARVPADGGELLRCVTLTTVGDYDIPTQPVLPKLTYVATVPPPPEVPAIVAPPAPAPAQSVSLPGYLRADVVNAYADCISEYNHHLDYNARYGIAYNILKKSAEMEMDPRLIFALIRAESDFDQYCVSHAGASGLGQLMPETAAGMGITDIFDVEQNIEGSVRELHDCLDTFGDVKLALAGYNAGCGAVRKYGGIPPYRETQNYVRTVWSLYCALAGKNE